MVAALSELVEQGDRLLVLRELMLHIAAIEIRARGPLQLLQGARMLLIKVVGDVLALRSRLQTIASSGVVLHHALGELANTVILGLPLRELARLYLEQIAGSCLVHELGCRGGLSGRPRRLRPATRSRRGRRA